MKRVRREEGGGGGGGGDEGASPEEPNDFGKWLIRKIYVYAAVREADELERVKKELRKRGRLPGKPANLWCLRYVVRSL
jgi:hypothetical protein